MQKVGVEQLKIRSVLTCESAAAFARNVTGAISPPARWSSLGRPSASSRRQSIGEPGTQLTMRTFHIGGTASQTFKQPIIKAKNDGVLRFNDCA